MPDRPNHAVRDGDYGVIYVATDKYLCKYFPHAKKAFVMLKLAAGEQGRMVGYGKLFNGSGPVKGVYLIPTFDDTPSGVWMHTEAQGWTFKGGLPDGQYTHVVANPRFPNQWIVWNQLSIAITGVQYTKDNGATWQALQVDATPHPDVWEQLEAAWFEFSLDGSEVLCNARLHYQSGIYVNNHPTILRGTLDDGIVEIGSTDYHYGVRGMPTSQPIPGDAGDIGFWHGVLYDIGLMAGAFGYYDAANTLHEIYRTEETFAPVVHVDPNRVVAPGSRALYSLFRDQIAYTEDYRVAAPQAFTNNDDGFGSLALLADSTIFVASLSHGILRGLVAGGSVTLTPEPDVSALNLYAYLRADRQTRRLVLARINRSPDSYVYDGTAWTLLPRPDTAVSLGKGGEAIAMPEDLQ
jgi:hypothetical protein